MALYSVWDWNRNAYAIYRTSSPVSVGDDPLPHRGSDSVLGADPDSGVKPLPSGARFVGYDHLARGEIRRRSSALGDSGDDGGAASGSAGNGWLMFGAGVLAASAYWWWRRSRS